MSYIVILNDRGVLLERPKRSDYPTDTSFVRAVHEHNQRRTNEANVAFNVAFKKALTGSTP